MTDHFLEILNVWQQGRKAFEQGDYPRALGLAQATRVMINEIDEMKSLYPPRGLYVSRHGIEE